MLTPFGIITINFITKLPKSKKLLTNIKYNNILIIVNKLTKYKYFILYKKTNNTSEITYTFNRIVII